jgi:hypothetical protein
LRGAIGGIKKLLFPTDLSAKLRRAASEWAETLPLDIKTPPDPLFTGVDGDGFAVTPSDSTMLRESVVTGKIPSQDAWFAALLKQWIVVRDRLGVEANAFFHQPQPAAEEHLRRLANTLHRTCVEDACLFRTTSFDLLLEVAAKTDAIHKHLSHVPIPAEPITQNFAVSESLDVRNSLYICQSSSSRSIGVAVTNSGLIVFAGGSDKAFSIVSLQTGKQLYIDRYISDGPIIHAVRCGSATHGVVPSYHSSLWFDSRTQPWRLFTPAGDSIELSESVADLDNVKLFDSSVTLNGLAGAVTEPHGRGFTPSPVFNSASELVGIAIGLWELQGQRQYEYLIQPWSEITHCLRPRVGMPTA